MILVWSGTDLTGAWHLDSVTKYRRIGLFNSSMNAETKLMSDIEEAPFSFWDVHTGIYTR